MRIFLLLIYFAFFLVSGSAMIAQPAIAATERASGLSCIENSYCSAGKWIAKKNCIRNVKAIAACDRNDSDCLANVCDCDVGPTGEDCDQSNPNKNNEINGVLGKITPPKAVSSFGGGEAGINNLLAKIVQLIFVVATVGFVFMVLLSALQMILSGGDKEAIGKARSRLTWAIIGIVLLSLSFVIFRVLGEITGFKFAL